MAIDRVIELGESVNGDAEAKKEKIVKYLNGFEVWKRVKAADILGIPMDERYDWEKKS